MTHMEADAAETVTLLDIVDELNSAVRFAEGLDCAIIGAGRDLANRLGTLSDVHLSRLRAVAEKLESYRLSLLPKEQRDWIEGNGADMPQKTVEQIEAEASPGLVEAVNLYTAAEPLKHRARLLAVALDHNDSTDATSDALTIAALEIANGLDDLVDQIGEAVQGGRAAA